MTDRLQVIDLVTNGPIKTGNRRKRVEDLIEYMQSWRIRRMRAKAREEELPAFDPPSLSEAPNELRQPGRGARARCRTRSVPGTGTKPKESSYAAHSRYGAALPAGRR